MWWNFVVLFMENLPFPRTFLSQPFWFSSLVENMLYEVLSYEWKQEEDGDGFFLLNKKIYNIFSIGIHYTLYLNSLQLCILVWWSSLLSWLVNLSNLQELFNSICRKKNQLSRFWLNKFFKPCFVKHFWYLKKIK